MKEDDDGEESCLRGPKGAARLQAALERAGLADFRVRPTRGARSEDCFVTASQAEPFDGRTIELDTDTESSGTIELDPESEPSMARQRRQKRRRCDRIYAKAERRGVRGLSDVLDCEIEPSAGCLTVADARSAAQRALRRARLEGWLVSVRREPGAKSKRLFLSGYGFDPRLREVRIELTEPIAKCR